MLGLFIVSAFCIILAICCEPVVAWFIAAIFIATFIKDAIETKHPEWFRKKKYPWDD